jgi:hypothetical protein
MVEYSTYCPGGLENMRQLGEWGRQMKILQQTSKPMVDFIFLLKINNS